MLGAAAMTVYQPAPVHRQLDYSLTIFKAASSPQSLRAPLLANIVRMIGAILYTSDVHRTFRGKVRFGEHGY